jgi:tetratricopeptide (TPR) repeat protein
MRSAVGIGLLLVCLAAAAAPAQGRRSPPRLQDLEATARRDSLVPEAHYLLAMGYWRAKRHDDAAHALTRAIDIDPRYAPPYVALAFLPFARRPQLAREARKGDVPPAWRDSLLQTQRLLRQAFMIDPLAELLPPDASAVDRLLATALLLGYFHRTYGDQPRDSLPPWVLWSRGLVYGRQGSVPLAIEDFQALLRRAETMEADSLIPFPVRTNDYRYILAVLCERADRPADALAFYEETVANDLGHYMAHVKLGRLYRRHRMYREAEREARRAMETNPDDPTTHRELGEILLDAGRVADAEAALRDAIRANPGDLGSLYVLAALLQNAGRHGEARETYQRFLSLAPTTLYGPQIADARARLASLPGQGN